MSSQRYSGNQTYQNDHVYETPYNQQVPIPISQSNNSFSSNINEQRFRDRINRHDTTVQWVNDGTEKFRVKINIDGFNQNEVHIRVDGNKLLVNGEHIETTNGSSAKKTMEKSYELPRDIDTNSPRVTFPSPNNMQVDFPSRHSNSIIDDGRISSNLISNYDTTTHRTPPRLAQERSSTEYTSTRKIGGNTGGGVSTSYERNSNPRSHSPYDDLYSGTNTNRNTTYSSTSNYQTTRNQSPLNRDFINTTTTATTGPTYDTLNNPTYTYRVNTVDSQPRTTFPTSSRGESGNVYEKTYSETHRETEHRRSSPTTGVQSSREVEHQRSGSPTISRTIDEDRFRTNLNLGGPSINRTIDEDRFRTNLNLGGRNITSPSSSSRNVEVREYSRRIGNNTNNNNIGASGGVTSSLINNDPLVFTHGFNSDAFYRSAFQPQVFTDNNGQKHIEMKLDTNNYQPNEIKISVNGNDLIVQAEHNDEHPPTSSSRAYFYKQITLPPNTDLNSLSSQYHPDGKLHITAKISQGQTSINYN